MKLKNSKSLSSIYLIFKLSYWFSLSPVATLIQVLLTPLSAFLTIATENSVPADVLILVDLSIVFFLLDLYSISGFKILFLKRNLHFLSHQEIGKRVFNQPRTKFLAKIKNSRTQLASLWRVSLANCSTYQKNKNRAGTICIRKVKDLPFYLCLWIMIIEECWYISNTHTLPHLPTTHTNCVSLGKSLTSPQFFLNLSFLYSKMGIELSHIFIPTVRSDSFNSKSC